MELRSSRADRLASSGARRGPRRSSCQPATSAGQNVGLRALLGGHYDDRLVLWIAQAHVIPRYLSYLLVPLFVLLATGGASTLERVTRRDALLRSVLCLVAVAVLAVRFAVPRARRHRPTARSASRRRRGDRHTRGFHAGHRLHASPGEPRLLPRPTGARPRSERARSGCLRKQDSGCFYVFQAFSLEDVVIPCLDRSGVEHRRFRQYARGEMNVWFVPPAELTT